MIKKLLLASAFLASALPVALPAPLAAQSPDRVLVIFGNDKCPTNAAGDEIVVCARRPESERFRIPKEFRQTKPGPANESWANRAASLDTVARSGTGSCTPSGAGGWTGCYTQQLRQAREEERQKRAGR